MNKTYLGLAIAVLIAAAAGFGIYSSAQKESAPESESASAETAATDDAAQAAGTEPAAADEKTEEKADNKEASADNPVVAVVDGEKITRSDVLDFMKINLPPQMKQLPPEAIFPMVLEQVVSAKIIDRKAVEAKTAEDPEVAKQMDMAKVQIIRGVFAEKQIADNYKESDTKDAYEKMVADMPKTKEAKASHILVEDEAKAKEIIAKLDGGAKFADLAKENSKDKSNADNGGDLGYFAQGDMVKEFGDAAFALKKGEYTKTPVKTQFGYHVILLDDLRDRPAPKYDDVKGELETKVKRDLLNKMMEEWRKDSTVETFDFNGKPVAKKGEEKHEEKSEEKSEEKTEGQKDAE